MLISQRIANDPGWLRTGRDTKSSKQAAFALRMKILKAVKMIVPRELHDTDRASDGLDRQIFGHSPPTKEESQKRLMLYSKFGRVPFPMLFIENHTGGALLEQIAPDTFDMYTLLDTGKFLYYHIRVQVTPDGIDAHTFWTVPVEEVTKVVGSSKMAHYEELKQGATTVQVLSMLELLLYVNTKNVVKHHYAPTKRENQSVPKPLLPHYSYYVLDLFKERKEYTALQDAISDFCNPNKPVQERRAGLVMGHFKNRATGLFWWNNYMRNAKNREKLGQVDKDYNVK